MSHPLYSIIVGADAGDLFFAPLSFLAHVRIGGDFYSYGQKGYDDSGILHYSRLNDFLPMKPEDTVLARRVFINFDGMHDNEIDARYHAMKSAETHGGIYRLEAFDADKKKITWFISDKSLGERVVETDWENKEQLKVSTTDYAEVDKLCSKHRISVVCDSKDGEEVMWAASSPDFRNMTMKSTSRSRAVIQLVLWTYYQRNARTYMGQDEVDLLLTSHAVEV